MAVAGQTTQSEKRDPNQNRVLPSADSIQSIGGLVVVVVGVSAVTLLAIVTMAFIGSDNDANTLIPLSTAAFGVISAVVGAYLGIKIGTDQSKSLAQDASQAQARLAAVAGFVPPAQRQAAQEAATAAAAATHHKH